MTLNLPHKVLLVANTGWYLYNFRRNLALELQSRGSEVVVVAPRDEYVERLRQDGLRWVEWKLDRSGLNPLSDLRSLHALSDIYRRESPQVVHHFTIKSILYGTTAAKWTGVPVIVNSVTGLGHLFTSQRLAARLLRPVMRRWYVWTLTTRGAQAVFQNADDLETLAASSAKLRRRAVLTRGSGVDLQRFCPSGTNGSTSNGSNGKSRALFAGRLIREKGIGEFLEAGRICKREGWDVELVVCGEPDPGNRSSLSSAELNGWEKEGLFRFLGHVDPIDQQIAAADMVVLPSYREGTPRVLLEAAAMGKPIVASDVPGCREVVVDGENGLLVPAQNVPALAAAMQRLLRSERLRHAMGEAGRRRMVARFDERQVISQTLNVYDRGCSGHAAAPSAGAVAQLQRGAFVFSLDMELAWGTRGRPVAGEVGPSLDGTRSAIQGLLSLMERYDVGATWAIVGALLLGTGNRRRHTWLAEECFADVPGGNAATQPHWYAEDIVDWLISNPAGQEIACHTLTHRFVDPSPAGREAFREELRRFRELFDQLYLQQPQSFIFPKAKMGHFDVLAEEGFRSFRGPESKWFESLPGALLPAVLRLADAKLARPPRVDSPALRPEGIWMLPSSQFYSPFMRVGSRVSVQQRVRKAIKGLRRAAATRGVFHLWTHPFNLGERTDELLEGLDAILAEARRLADSGQLDLLTMGQLADRLDAARHGADDDAARDDAAPATGAPTPMTPVEDGR